MILLMKLVEGAGSVKAIIVAPFGFSMYKKSLYFSVADYSMDKRIQEFPHIFSGSSGITLGGRHVTIDTDTVVTLPHHLSHHRLQAHPG